jgi:hypothetical protein
VTSLPRARYVPDQMSPSGDSRSLAVRRAKVPQASVSAGRPRIVAETSQAESPTPLSPYLRRVGHTRDGTQSSIEPTGVAAGHGGRANLRGDGL